MPGVPSGRGCESCRKQKKKCDETKPSCSRCTRLRLICVGSGQQRYKFKEEHGFPHGSNNGRIPKQYARSGKEDRVAAIPCASPSNNMTLLAHAFVKAIKASTDLKYNLAWTYGGFLEEVPRRLGSNEALDTAADAVVSAHLSFCVHRAISVEALRKYSRALSTLRVCLNDPIKARTSDTLCAVSLLLTCQAFIGTDGRRWTGHAEGAAQILKARRHCRPQDDFERHLLLSLRGPLLFEGLFNHRINLSSSEWKELVENELDKNTCEGRMLCCLARVPDIMQRGRGTLGAKGQKDELREETRSLYETFKVTLSQLQARWTAIDTPGATDEYPPMVLLQLHAHYQRSYGLGLAIGIILNCVLSAFGSEDSTLVVESTYFAKEITALAEQATRYRPLGASYMVLCLMAAWIGNTDKSLRLLTEKLLGEYQEDFAHRYTENLMVELDVMSHHMRLLGAGWSSDQACETKAPS